MEAGSACFVKARRDQSLLPGSVGKREPPGQHDFGRQDEDRGWQADLGQTTAAESDQRILIRSGCDGPRQIVVNQSCEILSAGFAKIFQQICLQAMS